MTDMSSWIEKINSCESQEELDAIHIVWNWVGIKYNSCDWPEILTSINTRKLELEGVDISEPAF